MIGAVPMAAWYALGGLSVAGASAAGGYYLADRDSDGEDDLEAIEGLEGAEGFEMRSRPNSGSPGIISSYRREKKRQEALDSGVVRWHLVGTSFESPKYVKPRREEGGNIPEIEYEDGTYLFPDDAAVLSEEEGVPVVVHRKGEAEPINLRDSWDDAIDAGTLSQYLVLRLTSTAPDKGLLDGLGLGGWDPMTIFRYGLLAIVGFAILMETMGGGLY